MRSTDIEAASTTKSHSHQWAILWIFLAYLIIAIVMTWPVISQFSTHLAGGRSDLWIHQWTFWWVKKALQTAQNPFYTHYLYYPQGVSLTSHNIAWFNIALWLPLQAIFENVVAYNLIFISILALNSFAAFLFIREITQSQTAAFIGGIVAGSWPYIRSHFDHPNLMVTFWVPLTLLYLDRTVKRPSWKNILLTAFFLAMIGITRWQLLVMSSPIIGSYLIYLYFTKPAARSWKTFRSLLIAGAISLAFMAPLATPVLIDQISRENPEDVFIGDTDSGRTDLLAYLLSADLYYLAWPEKINDPNPNPAFLANAHYVPYIGFVTILLAVYGCLKKWSKARFWLLLALLYIAFAFGPYLAINRQVYAWLPMPYRLVQEFPIIAALIRRPHRLNIFLSLPAAVLVSWGIVTLQKQTHQWKIKAAPSMLFGLIALVLLVEYIYPVSFTTTPANIPEWYEQIATDSEEYGVLDLPINDRSYDKWYMYYQTIHGKPILTGHVSRLPREAFDFLNSLPFLALALDQDSQADFAIKDVTNQLQMLSQNNVEYIVLHKQFANEGLLTMWRDWLTFKPFFEDEDLLVYTTTPRFGRDFEWEHQLTDEIGLIRASFSPLEAVQAGTIKVDARWGTGVALDKEYDICLQLTDNVGAVTQSGCQSISPDWPSSRWLSDEVVRASYVLPITESLEPGSYLLSLMLTDMVTGDVVGNTAVLGPVTIYSSQPTIPTQIEWGDQISLNGFDLKQTADELTINFFWQAQDKIDNSYKLFVHLIDPVTGQPAIQIDTIPRNWTYPTNIWEIDEIVKDSISLPLPELQSGQYELWLGLYDEINGERLPISAAGDLVESDGAVQLTTVGEQFTR